MSILFLYVLLFVAIVIALCGYIIQKKDKKKTFNGYFMASVAIFMGIISIVFYLIE